ncbi:HEPN domain-containing protein [Ketobacter alkanivorans]|uniref:Uncharacterized protein n=1 Tax=Ketobacter alkanivorans TaxID=1917421 RepID=A0A2K9LFQ9_9GAMM|nr:hypothetical protein [Ketobacter alkanivorans]AUM11216.1 hypothetical protein Kalk_01675 [Ketobacter alkanivorans]
MSIQADKYRHHGGKGWVSDNTHFSILAVTWQQWLGSAGAHLYTAQLILPVISEQQKKIDELMSNGGSAVFPPMVTSVFFFHCAISIENSLKAVISALNRDSIKSHVLVNERVPNTILGHDLVDLAHRAKFVMDINSEFILAFLTRYSIWSGKYPFAIKNSDNSLTVQLSDGEHYLVGGYNPKEVSQFLDFSEQIYTWSRSEVNSLDQNNEKAGKS